MPHKNIFIFLILVFSLFSPLSYIHAESGCTWRKLVTSVGGSGGTAVYSQTGGCESGEKAVSEKEESRCLGTKQESSSIFSSSGVTTETSYHCCCIGNIETERAKFIMPELQITIPGLSLSPTSTLITSKDEEGNYSISVPWIAEYIQAAYDYGLGIAGILAALVLMAGGVLWLISGGDASKAGQAKEMIVGSITGLVILACSYIILVQVNPELTKLKAIELGSIKKAEFEADIDSQEPLVLDINGISKILGVTCGQDGVAEIVNKAKGKVTYNNPDRGKTGPNNTVYNDCSGFASFVIKCAKNKNSGSYTGNIFSEQKAWDMDVSKLQPGDLVGWAPKNNKDNFGHVIIYLGNGMFGDCHGGKSGRKPGNCISNDISLERLKKYATSHSDGKLYFKRY